MNYPERKSLVSLFSTVLITGVYILYVLHTYDLSMLKTDLSIWGRITVMFVIVSIAAKIVITIIFSILSKLTRGEEEPSFADERDKLIEMKSDRAAHFIFSGGFLVSMILLWAGLGAHLTFLVILSAGFLGDLVSSILSFRYYHRGF